ncbi:MAG: NAD(P)-dependent oxidoreductase, partial [Pyrinomonadaceae bacterium]
MSTRGTILLTGAAGFVGRHATRCLLSEGYELVVYLKTGESREFFVESGVTKIYEGDLSDNCPALAQAFAETTFDGVVHLAALIKADWAEFERVNVRGTRRLVELAEGQPSIKHFVFTSTDFVLFDAENEYRESKRLGEELLRASKLPYTILRPSPIYGPGDDKNLASLLGIIEKMPVLPAPTFMMYPVYVGDVADAIVKVLASENVYRKEYNIPGSPVMTFREMLTLMRDALGGSCLLVPVPNRLFAWAVKVQEKLLKEPLLNYYQVEKWGMNVPVSAD